ncbi:MAG: tRNA uridine-5-carboxymethylaminomethyl(34) synthesis enzyme MnmG [Ruminococcaceae bacterium]|nr:tRNA uridine-5-carboxymethylaminomethyl(34) synthesis enzyme MnmG [Oscillospiraceae bacterium]
MSIEKFTTAATVIVVGGGHAGCEAALASARLGIDTVLFTLSLDAIGNLPCNPSIGGTAKGHLVFEIDALGGEMGRAADAVTLQSRTLNLGKGAAVHSKRVQADRMAYHSYMKHKLETTRHLRVVQGEVTEILTENGEVSGVVTSLGEVWTCQKVIIATGTYLGGRIFVGDKNFSSGPDNSLPALGLTDCLKALGLPLVRFKTGTPARIRRDTVDLSVLEEQPGEEEIIPFSSTTDPHRFDDFQQMSCHIVYTNEETHRVILENIHRSAMYSGQITGTGPRYCPSIEDKLKRFADKERHQLFVEPMGVDTEELYLQGFSTSLPTDVQHKMVRTLKGFENAHIMRYAYAIEYDCIDPTCLQATLECKMIKGFYGAGQFNGTSGYEEAAAQGLLAGINAALAVMGREQIILPRSGSYIGTLIDDLVTKGTNEPYRMMTSRSEFRLILRQDNADLRLTPLGYEVGLISEERYLEFLQKKSLEEAEKQRLNSTYLSPEKVNPFLNERGLDPVKSGVSLGDLLRRPQITYDELLILDTNRPKLPRGVEKTVEVDIKYEGYIKRELAEVERQQKLENKKLPENLDYTGIKGLRLEAGQKLQKIKPLTVGQAARISGVSPADITVLLLYLGLK